MQAKPAYLLLPVSIITACTLLGVLFGASLLAWSRSADATPVDVTFAAHTIEARPIVRNLPSGSAPTGSKAVQFPCQSNSQTLRMHCYGPYQIRQAYGVTGLLAKNITGQGTTITIIDAGGSPTIKQDLHTFNTLWGLPDSPLNVLTPFGLSGADSSWQPEVTVDVEWAHVMAPGATINLLVAKSSNDVDLYRTIKYAVDHNLGDVLSLSFGENESCADSLLRRAVHQVLQNAAQKRMTVLAATGDFGSAQYTCDNSAFQQAVAFPADDPLVTAVGGTTLGADAVSGRYSGEVAWNEADTFNKASGGGFSKYDTSPSYQNGVTGQATGRAVPDISLNAAINGGVLVYQTPAPSKDLPVTVIGGTSVGTPEVAGIIADGVQMAGHRLGQLNQAIYQLGESKNYTQMMNDITSGNNILRASDIPGYATRQGWDAVTGWGSPKQAEPFLRAMIGSSPHPPVNTPVTSPTPTSTPVSTPINVPVRTPISSPTSVPKGVPVSTPTSMKQAGKPVPTDQAKPPPGSRASARIARPMDEGCV